jgi:hypothetical protein
MVMVLFRHLTCGIITLVMESLVVPRIRSSLALAGVILAALLAPSRPASASEPILECGGSFHTKPVDLVLPAASRYADVGEFVLAMDAATTDDDFDYIADFLILVNPYMVDVVGSSGIDTLTIFLEDTNVPREFCFGHLIVMSYPASAGGGNDASWDGLFIHELAHAYDRDMNCAGGYHSALSWMNEGFAEATRHFVADRIERETGRHVATRHFDRRTSVYDLADAGTAQIYGGPQHVFDRLGDANQTYLLSAGTILIPAYAQLAAGHSSPHPLERFADAVAEAEAGPKPVSIYEAIDRVWPAAVDGITPPSRWMRARSITCPWTGSGEFAAIIPYHALNPHNNVNPERVRVYHFERTGYTVTSLRTVVPLQYMNASGEVFLGDVMATVHDVPAHLPAGAYRVRLETPDLTGGTITAHNWILVTDDAFHSGPLERGVAVVFVGDDDRPVDLGRDVSVNGRIVARVPGGVIAEPFDQGPCNLTFTLGERALGTVTAGPLPRVVIMRVNDPPMGPGVVEWRPYHPARGSTVDVFLRRSLSSLTSADPVEVTLFDAGGDSLANSGMTPLSSPDVLFAQLPVPVDLVSGVLLFDDGTAQHWGCFVLPCDWFFGYEFFSAVDPPPDKQATYLNGRWLVLVTEQAFDPANVWVLASDGPDGPWTDLAVTAEQPQPNVTQWDLSAVPDDYFVRITDKSTGRIVAQHHVPAGRDVPVRLALHDPYPNPSPGGVTLRVDTATRAEVTYEVFDVLGHRVDRVGPIALQPGAEALFWERGRDLPAGVYFIRVTGPSFSQTRKIVLVR